jgi:hypothetical protein
MKNFYEATVIRSTLTLPIKLTLDPIGMLPCLVKINNTVVYEDTINKQQVITHLITLNSPIDISIQIYRHHPDAIKISLAIDDHDILPLYQRLADPPTCYLDNNNIWTFKISNFYSWYHEITGQGWII